MTITTQQERAERRLIRDLDDRAFRSHYDCDRYTATVLGNRFDYLVEHMSARLLTGAFSPVLRDFYDLACTIAGPPELGYPVPAASNGIVLMAGTTIDAVPNMVSEYGVDRLRPGDVLIANDPYRTGNHNNDLVFTRPVFVGDAIVAFVTLNAHQLDMGGTVPGGFSATKQNVFENGLVLSPRLLVRQGENVPETWSVIFDNVRMAEVLYPDMLTVCSSLELGERLVHESIDRYGLAAFHGAMRYATDAAAERMALGMAELPDGDWEAEHGVDCDGVDDTESYPVHVAIRKRGDRIEVDFSGTHRQARTSINATVWEVKTAIGVALKYNFDPRGRFNSGLFRNIDIVVPEGTVVSALPPDGAVFLYFEQSQVILATALMALERALGDRAIAGDRAGTNLHTAFGSWPDGRPWVSAMQCGGEIGPYGANRHGDADTQCMSYLANGVAPSVEAVEKESPVVMLRHEPVPDTAGPGVHRGGNAMLRDTLWLTDAMHSIIELRHRSVTGFGVHGGGSGVNGGVWIFPPDETGEPAIPATDRASFAAGTAWAGVIDPDSNAPSADGEYRYPFANANTSSSQSVLRYITNGAGGWGDPLERDPDLVRRDVRDEYVTIEGAARLYGVVVSGDPHYDPEGVRVDERATQELRARLRSEGV
ncbi:hydantoinase B/oxoprolinase family protein [Agromyces aerolatus]|uniref:hydantoinase B/oxoprolinase family protein n=1 Tax=Agromyces sp. LY-1074 TaxID=3074080 RepID=UPI002861F6CC|nr:MULTISPECIES: hydantoinase B/oxoprolinase family protein [unclassified Agromyces]MDR5698690.1 hydantoinase B/oxoprolinase family protein [Agromyces sp. LY-1074]MDR5704984.1 hydantoinase B/oxoprolinase family protein [Agromyces sp. LY-1358]